MVGENRKNLFLVITDFIIAFLTMWLGDSSTGLLIFTVLVFQILFISNKTLFLKYVRINQNFSLKNSCIIVEL